MSPRSVVLLSIATALMAPGCVGPVPGRQLTIAGSALTYTAQPDGYSGSDQFSWTVTSSEAVIRYDGSALSAGSVQVTILDNAGQVVLDQTVGNPLPPDGPTQAGQVGQWQVRLDYRGATGTLDLQGSAAN